MCQESRTPPVLRRGHKCNWVCAQYEDGFEVEFSEKDKFLDWLFNDAHKRLSSTKKRAALTVVAHYGRGSDFNYILAYVRSNEKNCSPIYQGTKIMTLTVSGNKIRFIDSH